jgi:hypothetical protein
MYRRYPLVSQFRFGSTDAVCLGKPTTVDVSIALVFSEAIRVESIEQHADQPSAFRDLISKRGYGFHHRSKGTRIFDASRCLPRMIELIAVADDLGNL